jgi:hypothetical protein
MALKDLQSDLTNLKFGKDRAYDQPGMGFSDEPFIESPIQGGFADVGITFNSLSEGFIRGGAATHAARLATDVERISKFYLTPKGAGFITKQESLQLLNPQIRPGSIFNSPASNQRTYNLGVNTLAQIAASGTGLHVKREGLLATSFNGYIDDLDFTKDSNPQTGMKEGNRLLSLFADHIEEFTTLDYKESSEENGDGSGLFSQISNFAGNAFDTVSEFTQNVSEIFGGNSNDELYSYRGGAGSTLGIGRTTIRKYENTAQGKIRRDIGGKNLTLPHEPLNTKKQTKKYNKGMSPYHVSAGGYNGADVRNLQFVLQNQSEIDQEYLQVEDFIPFRFEAVNTDKPQLSDFILFRAFLDSFNDNYNASHNEYNYNGRGETFYTYNNFKRSINFGFKIAAQSKEEIQPLYEKLNYLVSNTAPEYSSAGRIRTPFIKLTVGDWCNRVPGVLNSVGLSWNVNYPWEIRNNEGILMLPHVLDVEVQFTPIHSFMPEKSMNSHFISVKPKTTTNSDTSPASNVVNPELLGDAPSIEAPTISSNTPRLPGYFANKTITSQPGINPNLGLPSIMGSEGL